MPPLPRLQHNPKREKSKGKQSYRYKDRGHQFISDHERTYRGRLSWVVELVKITLARGIGIRDILNYFHFLC
jgi:hypothetical protein